MADDRDLYATLGVPRTAGEDEIRSAYRKLARKYHPDVNPGDAAAEDRFKEIAAAFDVLGDAGKRKLYDEFGTEGLSAGFDPEKARAYHQWRQQAERTGSAPRGFHYEGDIGDLGDFSDILGDLFGRRARGEPHAGTRRGPDTEARIEIDFLDAVRGFSTTLSLEGVDPRTGERTRQDVRVNIPPGVQTGRRIRLRGQGPKGPGGGPAGDLYLAPTVRPHPRLTREGHDLTMDVPITVGEAIEGGRVRLPVPAGGTVEVSIPKAAQSGQKLRLKGKGVPAHGNRPAGDLYVRLMIQVPARTDASVTEAARKIDAAYGREVRADLTL